MSLYCSSCAFSSDIALLGASHYLSTRSSRHCRRGSDGPPAAKYPCSYKKMPNLTDLELMGNRSLDTFAFFDDNGSKLDLSKLQHLSFHLVGMETSYVRVIACLDICALRSMTVSHCARQTELLNALSDAFTAGTNKSRLHDLKVIFDVVELDDGAATRSVERLLKSCPPLSSMQIGISRYPLVDKLAIIAHADTLKQLMLHTSERAEVTDNRYYTHQDMQAIVTTCKRLVHLGIDTPRTHLGEFGVGGDEFRLSEGSAQLSVRMELESYLVSNPLTDNMRVVLTPYRRYFRP